MLSARTDRKSDQQKCNSKRPGELLLDCRSKSFASAEQRKKGEGLNFPVLERHVAPLDKITYTSVKDFVNKWELYRGRNSIVWLATCKVTFRRVALKAYIKSQMQERHFKNAQRERVILKALTESGFTGVVSLVGSFEDEGNIYLVTQYCGKGDLFQELMKEGGRMTEQDVCRKVVFPLLVSLEHLHRHNIIHRDIKAENIFFDSDGKLRLGDFGLAVNIGRERASSRVGTLDYMAPEVISMPSFEEVLEKGLTVEDTGWYDEKADIWSLGILVYELLAGQPPFEVDDFQQTANLIRDAPLEKFPEGISESCKDFIKKALEKEAINRWSASSFLRHPWVVDNAFLPDNNKISKPPPRTNAKRTPRDSPVSTRAFKSIKAHPQISCTSGSTMEISGIDRKLSLTSSMSICTPDSKKPKTRITRLKRESETPCSKERKPQECRALFGLKSVTEDEKSEKVPRSRRNKVRNTEKTAICEKRKKSEAPKKSDNSKKSEKPGACGVPPLPRKRSLRSASQGLKISPQRNEPKSNADDQSNPFAGTGSPSPLPSFKSRIRDFFKMLK